jgi:ParB family chromosome partitioning protein
MATTKKNGLGKGLDSLITNKVNTAKTTTATTKPTVKKDEKVVEGILVNINKVEPNREQPRKNFDEDALLELAESIKQFGVLQPLLVQQKDDYYEIIAGERRWRAAKLANLKEVPVIIKKLTEQEVVEISLIENIQRENLNPIEEAIAYKRLLTEFNLKQDEVAERVSKSRTAVTNSMRLLKLNEKVQQMVIDDMISTGHARALLGLNDLEKQYTVAQQIFDEKLSVRETEKLVKKIQQEKNQKDTEKNKKIDNKK